ncbi:MAG: hypothetical protein K9J79_10150, partial [Desulfobacteraceae bacterium]|nr:hypothetical protein [Desulfobacteraceae bacterium]
SAVCRNWAPDLQSDFNTLLNSVKMGFKGVSDPESIGYYEDLADERKEFQRKVRTVLRGITVLMRNRRLLNPYRHGIFAWQLISHKLMRWLVPFFLIIAFAANIFLLTAGPLYIVLFIGQLAFYTAALIHLLESLSAKNREQSSGKKSEKASERKSAASYAKTVFAKASRIAYYFVSVNASILAAWIKYIAGQRATVWDPSKR